MNIPSDSDISRKEAEKLLTLLPKRDTDATSPIVDINRFVEEKLQREKRLQHSAALAKEKAKRLRDEKIYGEYSKEHFEAEADADLAKALDALPPEAVPIRNESSPAVPILMSPTTSSPSVPAPLGGAGITTKEITRLMASLNVNLNVQLTKTDTQNLLATLLTCNEAQLKALYDNKRLPVAIRAVIKRIQLDATSGDITTIERLWDRIFGKNMLEVTMPTGYQGIIPNAPVSREAYVLIRQTLIG